MKRLYPRVIKHARPNKPNKLNHARSSFGVPIRFIQQPVSHPTIGYSDIGSSNIGASNIGYSGTNYSGLGHSGIAYSGLGHALLKKPHGTFSQKNAQQDTF